MQLLLIHTGGTIGMEPTPTGLAPRAGLVEGAIKKVLPTGIDLVSHVFSPLLDSANVGPSHWNAILDVIDTHPQIPVIITHGTDTMSFTGAALSQALAGMNRTVILCGSMHPLGTGEDAEDNLAQAIKAAMSNTAGVILAFAGKLLSAEGLVKVSSNQVDAFQAIPQESLAPPARRRFNAKNVAILTLSPGIPSAAVAAMLDELDAAVLRIFGSGTAMEDAALLAAIAKAVRAGKRIRAVSQCLSGGLEPGSYAAGAPLWQAGVENGGTETPEAALINLWLN